MVACRKGSIHREEHPFAEWLRGTAANTGFLQLGGEGQPHLDQKDQILEAFSALHYKSEFSLSLDKEGGLSPSSLLAPLMEVFFLEIYLPFLKPVYAAELILT